MLKKSKLVKAIFALIGIYEDDQSCCWVRLIEWACKSLGCLDFLHGMKGCVKRSQISPPPDWFYTALRGYANTKGWNSYNFDWAAGTILATVPAKDAKGNPCYRNQQFKIGKLLNKMEGVTPEMIKEFETRQSHIELNWEITSHLKEVAKMSYGRAWTSCMQPFGAHEEGVLSDMRAGSALILFTIPGAGQPCGRIILRPAVKDGQPIVVLSPRGYGIVELVKPEWLQDEIKKQTGLDITVTFANLDDVTGIYNDVYDDKAGASLSQEEEDMKKAEEQLMIHFSPYILDAYNRGKSAETKLIDFVDDMTIPLQNDRKFVCRSARLIAKQQRHAKADINKQVADALLARKREARKERSRISSRGKVYADFWTEMLANSIDELNRLIQEEGIPQHTFYDLNFWTCNLIHLYTVTGTSGIYDYDEWFKSEWDRYPKTFNYIAELFIRFNHIVGTEVIDELWCSNCNRYHQKRGLAFRELSLRRITVPQNQTTIKRIILQGWLKKHKIDPTTLY